MKTWTVRQRIISSFAAVVVLMLIMGGVAWLRLSAIDRDAESMEKDSLAGMQALGRLQSAVLEYYAHALEYVLNPDPAARDATAVQLRESFAVRERSMREHEVSIFHEEDVELFEALKARLAQQSQTIGDLIGIVARPGDSVARDELVSRLKTEHEQVLAAFQPLVDFDLTNANEAMRTIRRDVTVARTAIWVTSAVAIVLAIASGWLLVRAITQPLSSLLGVMEVVRSGDLTRRAELNGRNDEFTKLAAGFNRMTDELTALVGQVQKSGLDVTTSVTEIAATAKEQQATASEIAATVSEIGATSKEISATSRELVKTMSEVASGAEQSAELAGSGQTGLARMEDTMRQIMEAAGAINAKLAVLNEKAGNINQVVTTITKVADQTNLLSLNAAIEAEKAGEYGRGFSVVATEIRRLADQTAVATYDIEQMVKEMLSAVSAGVMGMDKFSEEVRRGVEEVRDVGVSLGNIIQNVQTMTPRFESVNDGMQAQATGAQQISEALAQLSEASQQTVESLRQSGVAIGQLNETARGLKISVERIRL